MDTTGDQAIEITGAELDLLSSKKKRKKKGSKSNGLQVQGYVPMYPPEHLIYSISDIILRESHKAH